MSTFGALRLQCQIAGPGISLDQIDQWLSSRYTTVLAACAWTGLEAHAVIETTAAYQSSTDSVTLTIGSNAVTGLLTTWTSGITGKRFYRPGDSVIYTATYVSATSLTLDRVYEGNGSAATGTVYAGSAYVLSQSLYTLPSDCRSASAVLTPSTGLPMREFTRDQLDRLTGPRTLVGEPVAWARSGDTAEASPPVLQAIEFYPAPVGVRGYIVEYVKLAVAFDGTNTSASPLPWISDQVLLAGVRCDIALYMDQLPKAAMYEAMYERELASILRVEFQQSKPPGGLRMADRFTRHRMARALGIQRGWGVGQGGPD